MATVYIARDVKHSRNVALKVLKPELAAVVGADRFLAEIETTANLQHPHILPLFDSGEADSFLFYVMPFVEGETLRERIDRDKQLPVEEAVRLATSIANALHTAHEAGVVHRDIKPGNILLSKGEPLVADFGIALAVGSASGARLTETGLSVGTPYYMSPEQATGDQAIGAASDIYALAAVLYEMLVGEPPYVGNTAQAVLGRILQGEPVSPTVARKSIPANVDAALRKALERLPADRFTDAQGFARALSDPAYRHGRSAGEAAAARGLWNPLSIGTTVAAALSTFILVGVLASRPEPPVASIERYEMPFRDSQLPQVFFPGDFGMSADGSALAYVGPSAETGVPQVWVRRWDDVEASPVRGTPNPQDLDISDDGSRVVYSTNGEVRMVPVAGGPEVVLGAGAFPSFGSDGYVYWDAGANAMRAPEDGGAVEVVTLDTDQLGGRSVRQVLPGGRKALMWSLEASDGSDVIHVLDLETREMTFLVVGLNPGYAQTGHILYTVDGTLMAAPFDAEEGAFTGPAVPLLSEVAHYTFSDGGKLLYSTGGAGALQELVWVSREGTAQPVEPGWSFDAGGSNAGWSLSPDGRMVALRERTDAGLDIWVKELGGGPRSRLTFDESEDRKPTWGPEPGYVSFLSNRNGESVDVWRRRADGTGTPELVLDLEEGIAEISWSDDGEWLAMRTVGIPGQQGGRDVRAKAVARDAEAIPLLMGSHDEISPSLSPNGRWLLYASNETGQYEVFVRPFPEVDSGRWQVSTSGGIAPRWSRDGTEVFYLAGADAMMVAEVSIDGESLRVGQRSSLFQLPANTVRSDIFIPYDVGFTADRQLLMARAYVDRTTQEDLAPPMVLVTNWFEELNQRVPTSGR